MSRLTPPGKLGEHDYKVGDRVERAYWNNEYDGWYWMPATIIKGTPEYSSAWQVELDGGIWDTGPETYLRPMCVLDQILEATE